MAMEILEKPIKVICNNTAQHMKVNDSEHHTKLSCYNDNKNEFDAASKDL